MWCPVGEHLHIRSCGDTPSASVRPMVRCKAMTPRENMSKEWTWGLPGMHHLVLHFPESACFYPENMSMTFPVSLLEQQFGHFLWNSAVWLGQHTGFSKFSGGPMPQSHWFFGKTPSTTKLNLTWEVDVVTESLIPSWFHSSPHGVLMSFVGPYHPQICALPMATWPDSSKSQFIILRFQKLGAMLQQRKWEWVWVWMFQIRRPLSPGPIISSTFLFCLTTPAKGLFRDLCKHLRRSNASNII